MKKAKLTVGIPAFKAQSHICDALGSIQMQTIKDEVEIIIANDNPGDDYSFVKKRYPELHIDILDTDVNTGPGLARQRCLDAATTKWITFMDADDVLLSPLSLEVMYKSITPQCIEVQCPFCQEIEPMDDIPNAPRMMPNNYPGHPWVFGRLYNKEFLDGNDISFSELRAMEDGEFNWKIRMTIEGSPLMININDYPVYFWRVGSEHSITRIGRDSKDKIPQYNFDLCQWGSTVAAIKAAKFCKEKNPFNGSITRFITEMMVGQYFTYIECLKKKPVFAKQNFFNAKRFYNECFKEIENQISKKVLQDIYTMNYAQKSQDLIGIIPEITFFDFMDKIKSEEYGGEEEFKAIRAELPKEIIDNDIKSGVATY